MGIPNKFNPRVVCSVIKLMGTLINDSPLDAVKNTKQKETKMKHEKIISVCLDDENTVKTVKEVYEDRYEGFVQYDSIECEMFVDDFKEQNKVWCKNSREGFDKMNTNENWEPEGVSIQDDLESFQKYLDETYGKDKYEAYALGAYIHSAVSFAFNKGEDTRCQWDSGTVGFVGINKELNVDLNQYAGNLSDAWNGWIERYTVYDNYDDIDVDEITTLSSHDEITKWKDEMTAKYGVTEYKQEN